MGDMPHSWDKAQVSRYEDDRRHQQVPPVDLTWNHHDHLTPILTAGSMQASSTLHQCGRGLYEAIRDLHLLHSLASGLQSTTG